MIARFNILLPFDLFVKEGDDLLTVPLENLEMFERMGVSFPT